MMFVQSFREKPTFIDYNRNTKLLFRLLKLTINIVAVVTFGPPLIALAILSVSNSGPIVFLQQRIGFNGRSFDCFKSRTMVVDVQERLARLPQEDLAARFEWERGYKLRNDPRITPLGHFLRKRSFGKLPQFFNLINGMTSAVGPTADRELQDFRYGASSVMTARSKPEITGLWQVSGRSKTPTAGASRMTSLIRTTAQSDRTLESC